MTPIVNLSTLAQTPINTKCQKLHSNLTKYLTLNKGKDKSDIKLSATGEKSYMMYLNLLRCEVKNKEHATFSDCQTLSKKYELCHSSMMGAGTYKNKSNCVDEVQAFEACIYLKPP